MEAQNWIGEAIGLGYSVWFGTTYKQLIKYHIAED